MILRNVRKSIWLNGFPLPAFIVIHPQNVTANRYSPFDSIKFAEFPIFSC